MSADYRRQAEARRYVIYSLAVLTGALLVASAFVFL